MVQTISLLFAAFALTVGAQPRQRIHLLVTHGTALTMDAQRHIIDDGAIAVQGDTIPAIGDSQIGVLGPNVLGAHCVALG